MIRLLIFDLDGTSIDSAQDYTFAVNRILTEHGHPSLTKQDIIFGLGNGLRALLHRYFPEIKMEDQEFLKMEGQFLKYYEEICLTHAQFYPGALEFLRSWDGPLALVTNKNSHPTYKILNHYDLGENFWKAIHCYDTFPEKKPHPRPLLEAIKVAGLHPSQAVMIGDGLPDMMAAQAAGIKSIAVRFGYTEWSELQKYNPSASLFSYTELPSVIESLNPS